MAELLSDAYADESAMMIRVESDIRLDTLVYLEARDGSSDEALPVMHVFGNYILFKETLKNNYLIGSKLWQAKPGT